VRRQALVLAVLSGLALGGAVSLPLGSPLAAQNYREVEEGERDLRGLGGLNLQISIPQGEFADFVGEGFGVGGHLTFLLDRSRRFGIRLYGSWIQYGRTSERIPFPGLPGISVDLTTSNDIYSFGVGPEFQLGTGGLRPYLYGTFGASNFATTTSAEGSNNTNPFASSTNFNDWTYALTGGGGLMFQISHGRTPIWLDGGLRYQSHGQTRYLREGSLDTDPGGNVIISPVQSRTDMLVVHLGIQLGF
jgi:hypothetical protein